MMIEQAGTWIQNGAPPVIVAAAYFESPREKLVYVGEFRVAVQLIGEHVGEVERKKTATTFISSCKQRANNFLRYDFDQYKLGRFCASD